MPKETAQRRLALTRKAAALAAIACIALGLGTWAVRSWSSRPKLEAPPSALAGVRLGMTEEEVAEALGYYLSYVGDDTFSWFWYPGAVSVGLAPPRAGGEMVVAWVAQTAGSYEGLAVGERRARAERLYGRAAEVGGYRTISCAGAGGERFAIVCSEGKVLGFSLCGPAGGDPDPRRAGLEPGLLPTYRFPQPGMDIFPTAPGTRWGYREYDENLPMSVLDQKEVLDPDPKMPGVVRIGHSPTNVITYYYRPVGDIVFRTNDKGEISPDYPGVEPARLYVGLRWAWQWPALKTLVRTVHRVVGVGPLSVEAGAFSEVYVVEVRNERGWVLHDYYVEGIGVVKAESGGGDLASFEAPNR